MKILIVAATQQEIEPLFSVDGIKLTVGRSEAIADIPTTANCQPLITGVGMVATTFALTRHLVKHEYDLAINLGICGSFDHSLDLGEVVEITNDILAELGAEDDEEFLTIEQLGFGESEYSATTTVSKVLNQAEIKNDELLLKQTYGITVNTVHGNEVSIRKIIDRLNPSVESMEGAAFFYVCRTMGIPCIQIRAVSNYVEKRNRNNWNIGLAVKNLNIFADKLLQQLIKLS